MGDPKIEILKNEITYNIVKEFNLQIDEVLSICESEIEKLMLLHLYRYFQTFKEIIGDEELFFNRYTNLKCIEDFIDDGSRYLDQKLQTRIEKYCYRENEYGFLKFVGFKVLANWREWKGGGRRYDYVSREFEVRPQYPVTIDDIEYRIDIAVIFNRKTPDGKIIESKKVALECDGYDYHSSPEQKKNDDIRTRKFKKSGWKEVLRYSGKELHSLKSRKEVHSLFEEIIDVLNT